MPYTETRAPLIAVVEADSAVRESFRFTLEVQGYEVCVYDGGMPAAIGREIAMADCIVIGDPLPDMGALALLRGLRRRGIACPAVLVVGDPAVIAEGDAAKAGAAVIGRLQLGEHLNGLIRTAVSRAR